MPVGTFDFNIFVESFRAVTYFFIVSYGDIIICRDSYCRRHCKSVVCKIGDSLEDEMEVLEH